MTEPRMPTTLPSPVDLGEVPLRGRVNAAGATWYWVEVEMVWVRVRDGGRERADGRRDAAACTDGGWRSLPYWPYRQPRRPTGASRWRRSGTVKLT